MGTTTPTNRSMADATALTTPRQATMKGASTISIKCAKNKATTDTNSATVSTKGGGEAGFTIYEVVACHGKNTLALSLAHSEVRYLYRALYSSYYGDSYAAKRGRLHPHFVATVL